MWRRSSQTGHLLYLLTDLVENHRSNEYPYNKTEAVNRRTDNIMTKRVKILKG